MKIKEFLHKKNVLVSYKVYLIDVLGNMAMGLFASLLIGTILNTIGTHTGLKFLSEELWPLCKDMTGPAIAAAIGVALKAPNLVMLSSLAVGYIGNELGGPVGCLIASVVAIELGKLISKETMIDIIATPLTVILSGFAIAKFVGPSINMMMVGLGDVIIEATKLRPFFMGMVVSLIVGMVLTLPISSAALCMMLGLSDLAAGAATAGCCAQMVGFAVISFKVNRFDGLLAQGLGTSMLQIPNIVKNWKIWLAPSLASVITGPIATCVFHLKNTPLGAGMGTSGLVGILETFNAMSGEDFAVTMVAVLLTYIVLPAVLSLLFHNLFKKMNLVKDEDLRLNLK